MTSERKPRTALIYARVASGYQALVGTDLDSQLRRCRDYAARVGLDVKAVFADDWRSGPAGWGPGMLSMLQHASDDRSTQFVIIVDDASRLTRNLDRYFTLERKLKAIGAETHTTRYRLDSDPELIEDLMAAIKSQRRRPRK